VRWKALGREGRDPQQQRLTAAVHVLARNRPPTSGVGNRMQDRPVGEKGDGQARQQNERRFVVERVTERLTRAAEKFENVALAHEGALAHVFGALPFGDFTTQAFVHETQLGGALLNAAVELRERTLE